MISGVVSFMGSFLSTVGLVVMAPALASVAYRFGPAEYFALYMLACATLGGLTSNNQAKSAFAACLGLELSMVGLDNSTSATRFTGGTLHLYDGIDFLVAIVGLFAISEIFIFIESHGRSSALGIKVGKLSVPWGDLKRTFGAMMRGTGLGFIAGILPGAGASLGSFMAYMAEKSFSNRKGTFGKGDPRGVAAPEAGNNAAAGGAMIPMLTLGVPGSGTTAVMLALLLTLNITPGPRLFTDQPQVVWGLIASLFIANVVLLILNVLMERLFVKILSVPPWFLMPMVTMVSFVGIFSLSGSYFDLLLMIIFGVLGYILRKLDVPTMPVILGILLGNQMEDWLRRGLTISDGDWMFLFSSPIAVVLWILAVGGFLAPLFLRRVLQRPPVPETDLPMDKD